MCEKDRPAIQVLCLHGHVRKESMIRHLHYNNTIYSRSLPT